ncbi:MAG: thymidine phosphorylase [Myxococcaceae bacterium]|nr:thymidine phosphorylase [Myxococcaceae bacterium]
MRPYEFIKAKRDGQPLAPDDIRAFLAGYTRGDVADYQMAAMCMAIYFKGLSPLELAAWASAMLQSGEVLDLSATPGVKVDKHSTGGVGDKVSLSLAPLAAACGVPVPMISGRGLGHTGGTLDKLESIPGFKVDLSIDDYKRLVRDVGACLIGQTATLAPADKKLYALRDVTATVDCIPLIASSIMSKKMAEGIDALVLDVKVGSGAFMKTLDDGRVLAKTMISIGEQLGKKVRALLTDMDQPLGNTIGNALEVIEAVEMLQGRAPADYTELTLALTAEMLVLGQKAKNVEEARVQLKRVIDDGSAVKKLQDIVAAQGGNPKAVLDFSLLPKAKATADVVSDAEGYVEHIDSEALGLAAMALGAGRERSDAAVDHAVGLVLKKKKGDPVAVGESLVTVHYNAQNRLEDVKRRVRAAYRIGRMRMPPGPLVLERL